MSKAYSLAFWFVLIGTVFADIKKCSDALKNKAFDGPDNNVLLKLFKESQLEDEELKQFVCDLSEHQIVIGAAFNDQAQALPPPTIKPSLMEEFEFLKKIELVDKPAAELMHKLHKSISMVAIHPQLMGMDMEEEEPLVYLIIVKIVRQIIRIVNTLDNLQHPADTFLHLRDMRKRINTVAQLFDRRVGSIFDGKNIFGLLF
uniref:Secreted protein n=1 Tax=Globodera pallida TaxID=36090 RepID=A0A183C5C5_GLOPA